MNHDGKPDLIIILGPEGIALRHFEAGSITVELRIENETGSALRRQVVAANTVTVLVGGVIRVSS